MEPHPVAAERLAPSRGDALAPETRELLATLGPLVGDGYLAGSAALALYVGHRRVRNLDLMSARWRLRPPERRDLLQGVLERVPEARVETARDGLLALRFPTGPGVKLFYYPYPLVASPHAYRGVAVAAPVDLGLMKLGAIISRGTRRDFVDLYRLVQRLSLAELLAAAPTKFPRVIDFPLQAMKGLADHRDALAEAMPVLEEPLDWATVERWIDDEVAAWGRRELEAP